jgi:hypothetical protein
MRDQACIKAAAEAASQTCISFSSLLSFVLRINENTFFSSAASITKTPACEVQHKYARRRRSDGYIGIVLAAASGILGKCGKLQLGGLVGSLL